LVVKNALKIWSACSGAIPHGIADRDQQLTIVGFRLMASSLPPLDSFMASMH